MIKKLSILILLTLGAYYCYRPQQIRGTGESNYKIIIKDVYLKKSFKSVVKYNMQRIEHVPAGDRRDTVRTCGLAMPSGVSSRITISAKEKSILDALILQNEWDRRVASLLILNRFMNLVEVSNYAQKLMVDMKNHPDESFRGLQMAWNNLFEGEFLVERANCILMANDLNVDKGIINKLALEELLNANNVQELKDNSARFSSDDALDPRDDENERLMISRECAFKKVYAIYLQSSAALPDETLDGLIKILEMHENLILKIDLIASYMTSFPEQRGKLLQALRQEDEQIYKIALNRK